MEEITVTNGISKFVEKIKLPIKTMPANIISVSFEINIHTIFREKKNHTISLPKSLPPAKSTEPSKGAQPIKSTYSPTRGARCIIAAVITNK